jgi:hypothetical protein
MGFKNKLVYLAVFIPIFALLFTFPTPLLSEGELTQT